MWIYSALFLDLTDFTFTNLVTFVTSASSQLVTTSFTSAPLLLMGLPIPARTIIHTAYLLAQCVILEIWDPS